MEKYIGTYHKSSPFIKNLLKKQICSFEILWQNPPQFADFPKSATGQLPTCACRIPPQYAHFLKSATGQLLTCACRNSSPVCRFSKNLPLSADLLKSACRNSPQCVKGIVGNSAIVISTTPWTQHISFALGNINLFQQTR